MKIQQNVRHWAAKRALTTPILGSYVTDKLVDLHTRIFLDRADEAHRKVRRAHLDDPLGAFRPAGGVADAPSTPGRLDDPEHPHAEGGFAGDVYVETDDGELVVGGQHEPGEAPIEEVPGWSVSTVAPPSTVSRSSATPTVRGNHSPAIRSAHAKPASMPPFSDRSGYCARVAIPA